jgi:hypothetical protein
LLVEVLPFKKQISTRTEPGNLKKSGFRSEINGSGFITG